VLCCVVVFRGVFCCVVVRCCALSGLGWVKACAVRGKARG